VSRIYRVRWAAAFTRSHELNSQLAASSSDSERRFVVSLDGPRADAKSLAAKVRKVMAAAEAELLAASDRPYVIKRRMHVSCKAKYVVAVRNQPSGGGPALMQAALGDEEPVVLKSHKLCTVRYRLTRVMMGQADGKQDFEITLPDLHAAAAEQAHPKPIE
jgi:hypothetical protein